MPAPVWCGLCRCRDPVPAATLRIMNSWHGLMHSPHSGSWRSDRTWRDRASN